MSADVNLDDLEITVGCLAAHPDRMEGRHVAKQCTGVRIHHRPTDIEIMVDSERSQHANRVEAMRLLRDALACSGCRGDTFEHQCSGDNYVNLARQRDGKGDE